MTKDSKVISESDPAGVLLSVSALVISHLKINLRGIYLSMRLVIHSSILGEPNSMICLKSLSGGLPRGNVLKTHYTPSYTTVHYCIPLHTIVSSCTTVNPICAIVSLLISIEPAS
jgi:hypothetical protein